MMKKHYKIIVTAVIVVFLLAVASLIWVLKVGDPKSSFWSDDKGTKNSNGEIKDNFNSAPTQKGKNDQAITQTPGENTKIPTPLKALLIGDSMILEGFGPVLEKTLLKYNGVSVVREGVYSTGLNRNDYFDWYAKTDELIALHNPDILIVLFGGNDGQGIIDKNNKAYPFGSEGWTEVYRERVNAYLIGASPKVKRIYWVGHPITGNANFLKKFLTMNSIYQSESAKFPNVVFVNSWNSFAVNGEFRKSIPDDKGVLQVAIKNDGVHVTEFGGQILSDLVINEVKKDVELK